MEEFLLSPAAGVLIRLLILWGPLVTLSAVCVLTLRKLEPKRRRGLLTLLAVMLALAATLFGGAWALGRCGLAWRTWVREGLAALLWLAGLSTGLLTVIYGGRWLPEWRAGWGQAVVCLSGLCLAGAMFSCSVLGALWCMGGPGEQVGTCQGRRVVQGEWVWLDTSYVLYEYHGPLVRGAEPIAQGLEPLLDS